MKQRKVIKTGNIENTKMMNEFYTYAYLREDGTPYYIGKGTGNRIYSTWRRLKPPKDKSRIIFLKQNLTEEEAFKHEIYMIAVFGRKDLGTGILRNLTNGGEGPSGMVHGEETRRKISEESKKGRASMTPEQRSEASRKAASSQTPEQRSQIAKKRQASKTQEQRSEAARKGRASMTPEQRSEAVRKGRANMTQEQRSELSKKQSEGQRKRQASMTPEQRSEIAMKRSEANRGKKWWNDGLENRKFVLECPGDGWIPGMKIKSKNLSVSKNTH